MKLNLAEQVFALTDDGHMEAAQIIGLHDDFVTIVSESGVHRVHRSKIGVDFEVWREQSKVIAHCTHCALPIHELDPHVFHDFDYWCWGCWEEMEG